MGKRVLVLGGGLSALVAGLTLREMSGGNLEVELLERGHVIGGKASSKEHPGHQEVDHGFHVFFDYPNFQRILKEQRAWGGLKPNKHTMEMYWKGKLRFFRSWRLPAPLHLLQTAMPWAIGIRDGYRFARFYLASAMLRVERLSKEERERLDDLKTEELAKQLGLSEKLLDSELFHFFARSAFNWPYPTSALSMLRATRLVSQNHQALQVRYLDGGANEVLIKPVQRGLEQAGATIRRFHEAKSIEHADGKVTGLRVENKRHFPHKHEARSDCLSYYHSTLKTHEAREESEDSADRYELFTADYYLSTLPPRDLPAVLDDELKAMPYFAGIDKIETQPTIAYQVYYDQLVTPKDFVDTAVAVPGPFSTIFDRARHWTKPDGRGSVMVLVGELGKYKDHTPETIMELGDKQIEKFFPDARGAKVVKRWFHRGGHDDFTMTVAGTGRYRPAAQSPLENLVLAGDYADNGCGVVCMEGAVMSGIEAANVILEREGYPKREILRLGDPGGLIPAIRWFLKKTGLFRRVVGYQESDQ